MVASPPSPSAKPVQILIIGGKDDPASEFSRLFGSDPPEILHVDAENWDSTNWQEKRLPGVAWSVILSQGGQFPFDEELRCTQLASLVFRPNRLVIADPALSQEEILFLLKAGANGVVQGDPTPEAIVEECRRPGIRHEDFFPDPVRWLQSLVRASEELGISRDPRGQVKKLLRIFATQLHVDRASVAMVEKNELIIIAGLGMPPDVQEGVRMTVAPNSITEWVLENRRARLVEGEYTVPNHPRSDARSAVCAPLISNGEVLGVVNFTSLEGGRMLNQADQATAEVFSSLLAMAIANQSLHQEILRKERLATVGETISTISHCMKNVLTILRGSLSVMKMALDRQDPGQMTSGYQMLQKGVQRVESLALDLLDFCRERKPDFEAVELDEIFATIKDTFSVLDMKNLHRLEMVNELQEKVMVDENRLQRALLNLITNAVDATPEGGTIRLSAGREENDLILSVEDNGPGVSADELRTIFDAFYSTKGSKGTGLGLAMVHKFCEECDGSAEADYSPELGGLRMKLRLPCKSG